MAETRVEEVDDNTVVVALLGTSGEFAAKKDFKQFGDIVPKVMSKCMSYQQKGSYLSPMSAVSLSFKVLKIFGAFLSGKLVKAWTSELTMTK